MPRAEAAIKDVWHVIGLRGTGSDTYSLTDHFVPEERAIERARPAAGASRGRCTAFNGVFTCCRFGAVALGIARATLDAFVALPAEEAPAHGNFGQALRENGAVQARIGLAEAQLRGTRLSARSGSGRLCGSEGDERGHGRRGIAH